MDQYDDANGQSVETAREERPGCLVARATGVAARLVLAVAPLVMAAQVGQWLAWRTGWGQDAAFALAIVGALLGAALAVALVLRGAGSDGGRRLRADLALCLLACLFLARAVLAYVHPLAMEDVGVVYVAALGGALVVWLMG